MNLQVVEWAARECTWQRSGEMSVLWMLNGWDYARQNVHRRPDKNDILELAYLVEPRAESNARQWPTT